MIDYRSYPKASLVRVVHPGQQKVGHRYNNVGWGIPKALLPRYYRPAKANGDPEWFLDPDHPAWDELLPFVEAKKLYVDKVPAKSAAALAAEQRQEARDQWWSAVKTLPGGMDPLWRYGSESDEDIDDRRWMLVDTNDSDSKPWFPRIRLRLKYGTTSLREYAAMHGLPYPG